MQPCGAGLRGSGFFDDPEHCNWPKSVLTLGVCGIVGLTLGPVPVWSYSVPKLLPTAELEANCD